jgi:hypothetical protein
MENISDRARNDQQCFGTDTDKQCARKIIICGKTQTIIDNLLKIGAKQAIGIDPELELLYEKIT